GGRLVAKLERAAEREAGAALRVPVRAAQLDNERGVLPCGTPLAGYEVAREVLLGLRRARARERKASRRRCAGAVGELAVVREVEVLRARRFLRARGWGEEKESEPERGGDRERSHAGLAPGAHRLISQGHSGLSTWTVT